jgi:hypothetical protein
MTKLIVAFRNFANAPENVSMCVTLIFISILITLRMYLKGFVQITVYVMDLEGRFWSFPQGRPTSKSLVFNVTLQSTNMKNIKNYKPVYSLRSPIPTNSPALILPSSCPSRLPLSTPLFHLLSITTLFPFSFFFT